MCGPSDAEQGLASNQAKFSDLLQSNYSQQFAQQSNILNSLNQTLTPIVEAGPGQTGFSPQELAAQNTQALNTTGANYANAARALGNQLAGRNGTSSTSGLESGVDKQIKSSLASQAAGQLSNEELGITQRNYETGRQNFNNAVGGERALAGLYDPNAYASQGINANQSAFGEAGKINQEQGQKWATIGGLVTGGLNVLSGGLSNLDTTGSSTGKEQALNFLSGA